MDPATAANMINALANLTRAEAMEDAVKAGKVNVMIMNGSAAPAVSVK